MDPTTLNYIKQRGSPVLCKPYSSQFPLSLASIYACWYFLQPENECNSSSHISVGIVGITGLNGHSYSPSVSVARPGGLKRNPKPLREPLILLWEAPRPFPGKRRASKLWHLTFGIVISWLRCHFLSLLLCWKNIPTSNASGENTHPWYWSTPHVSIRLQLLFSPQSSIFWLKILPLFAAPMVQPLLSMTCHFQKRNVQR